MRPHSKFRVLAINYTKLVVTVLHRKSPYHAVLVVEFLHDLLYGLPGKSPSDVIN